MDSNRTKQIEGLLLNFHNANQQFISKGKFSHPGADITFSQLVALEFIGRNQKSSIDEISKAMRISSSAATQLVNCLIEKKFVSRKIGLADKRFSSVELSAKAKKLFSFIKKIKIMKLKKLFSDFTDKELKTFVSLMKKLTINI